MNPTPLVGYVADEDLPIHPGDYVIIPKGTPFKSTHPARTEGILGRTLRVRVDHVLNGSSLPAHEIEYLKSQGREANPMADPILRDGRLLYPMTNPTVRYAGSGGYWVEVDINRVQKAIPLSSD